MIQNPFRVFHRKKEDWKKELKSGYWVIHHGFNPSEHWILLVKRPALTLRTWLYGLAILGKRSMNPLLQMIFGYVALFHAEGRPYFWGSMICYLAIYHAVYMLSDYRDYIRCWDVYYKTRSTLFELGLIQKDLKFVIFFLSVFVFFGFFLILDFIHFLTWLSAVCGIIAFFLWEYVGIKNKPFGEWLLGFVFGPLVFIGLSGLSDSEEWYKAFMWGIPWGVLYVVQYLQKKFPLLLYEKRLGLETTLCFFGFDRGRNYFFLTMVTLWVTTIILIVWNNEFWLLLIMSPLLLWAWNGLLKNYQKFHTLIGSSWRNFEKSCDHQILLFQYTMVLWSFFRAS